MNKFNFSFTCTNTIFYFLENSNSYIAENFNVHLYYNELSIDISHFVVA